MRIESTGIYTSNGQIGKVAPNTGNQAKSRPSTTEVKKPADLAKDFSALLSQAETTQLTKLFGKFDLKELSKDASVSPEDDRPGQFIDIVV
jgi:hypothetical protein